jgi:hypothetical protein
LLSSRGISTPSLQARGEQRRFFYFNNDRDIPELNPEIVSDERTGFRSFDVSEGRTVERAKFLRFYPISHYWPIGRLLRRQPRRKKFP